MNGKGSKKEVLLWRNRKEEGMWECGVFVFQLKYFNQIEVFGYFMIHNHIVESRTVYYTDYAEEPSVAELESWPFQAEMI